MEPFLKKIAQHILQQNPQALHKMVVVFPNRRAGLFFTAHLSRLLAQPQWSPKVLGLQEFIEGLSPYTPADPVSLVFRLYQQYKRIAKSQESPDNFYFWGQTLLQDFDEADKALVPTRQLFTNVQDLKAYGGTLELLSAEQKAYISQFWQSILNQPQGSNETTAFTAIWQVLHQVYQAFTQSLAQEGLAYQGMAYRHVAQQMQEDQFDPTGTVLHQLPPGHLVLAGFNALGAAEQAIVSHLVQRYKAQLLWDADALYVQDPVHEAGHFFRQYQQHKVLRQGLGPGQLPTQLAQNKALQIHITGVPLQVGQGKLLGQKLAQLAQNPATNWQKVVVVLPDQALLFTVLHALPPSLETVNVTMGYPLRHTPVYSLLEGLLDLQLKKRMPKLATQPAQCTYYHVHVLALLRHPYVYHTAPVPIQGLIDQIEQQNTLQVPATQLLDLEVPLLKHIFTPVQDKQGQTGQVFDYLLQVLFEISSHQVAQPEQLPEAYEETLDLEENQVEQEFLYQGYVQLQRLKEEVLRQELHMGLNDLLKLFRQLIPGLKLPFSGEPLVGLQIMGVVETHNLDFDHVFMLSMNEGTFPPAPNQASFIPYNLRRGFNMPVPQHLEASYAYYFYRLLHRAKNVHLFYNTEDSHGLGGEMSRYLYQLLYQVPAHWQVKRYVLGNPVTVAPPRVISIEKTPQVLQVMQRYTTEKLPGTKLSPTALNTYLDCRLRFYFRHVAQVYEPERVQEEVDHAVFGTIVHACLELLYAQYMERKGSTTIEQTDFEHLRKALPNTVNQAFKDHYNIAPDKAMTFEGRNVIAREVVQDMAQKVLDIDAQTAPFDILGLELGGKARRLPILLNDAAGTQVLIEGSIDRVDQTLADGVIRVLDYKTGQDKKHFTTLEALFDRQDPERNKAAMQTFLYALMYSRLYDQGQTEAPIQAGLFNVKELYLPDFDPMLRQKEEGQGARGKTNRVNNVRPMLPAFEQALQKLLQEIWNPAQPFDQTDKPEKCHRCPYNGICHRG